MTYSAKIKTGKSPLIIVINKPKIYGNTGMSFKLKKGAIVSSEVFENLIIPADEACCFIKEYAHRRELNLGYDESNGNYVLFNPRYNTFRFIHLHDEGYDILSFIEPEYVTVKRS